MQFYLLCFLHARSPVILQIANAFFLALGADALVEVDGLADALFQRKTARAEGFEFTNVGAVRGGVAGQRPELFDLVLLDPHHAGADGRGEKLVQAGAEVVAVQIGEP